jgi:CRP-like cAMP-binding protein
MQNLLLSALPPDELTRVVPALEAVPIVRKTVMYKVGDIVTAVYFPSGGLVGEVATLGDGQGLEVITIGREGALGLGALFGLDISLHEIKVQMTGAAWRIEIGALKRLMESCPVLNDRIMRYFNARFLQVAQTAACSGRHSVSQRCANKLVDAHERSGSTSLPLTHEGLAYALGVRRAGITVSMAALEREGSIRCMRGSVEIVDVEQLRHAACDCSTANVRVYERLFPQVEHAWSREASRKAVTSMDMTKSLDMVKSIGRA